MRFDKRVDVFTQRKELDGQGGYELIDIKHENIKANVLEKPLEYIAQVYGDTMLSVIDVVLFTRFSGLKKVRYNGVMYGVKRIYTRGNKTYILGEEIHE